MCLAIPGLVETIFEENGLSMASVDFGGIRRNVCVSYVEHVRPGQYVLVHVGFALSIVDEEEAKRSLSSIDAAAELGLPDIGRGEDVEP